MSVFIYFKHDYRGSVGKLHVDDGLEDSDNERTPEEIWKDMKYTDTVVPVARISTEEVRSKRWLIVHDMDFEGCVTNDGIEETSKYYLTDEDPMTYIAKRFIRTTESCREEECGLIHSDTERVLSIRDINMGKLYCNVQIHSPGIQCGLRVVDTRKKYPDWIGQIPGASDPEDYCHMIYVFDTAKLK